LKTLFGKAEETVAVWWMPSLTELKRQTCSDGRREREREDISRMETWANVSVDPTDVFAVNFDS
jgi:hypothetical protein